MSTGRTSRCAASSCSAWKMAVSPGGGSTWNPSSKRARTSTRWCARPTVRPTDADDRTGPGVRSTNGAHSGNQWQVERGHPTRRQVVDRGDCVEGPEPRRQATGGRRVPTTAVGEAEGRLLGDRRCPLDLDPVDVVLGAAGPFGRRASTDAVHVLELAAGLARV